MSAMRSLDRAGDTAQRLRRPAQGARARACQGGVLLLELLVGLAVGMLVVTAATGLLLLSRGTTTTVTELSHLQQQGAHALRVIGRYVRQAGAQDLRADPASAYFSMAPKTMEGDMPVEAITGSEGSNGAPDALSVSHQRASGLPAGSESDCLGSIPKGAVITSSFRVAGENLRCGNGVQSYAMTGDVADFQLRYRVATPAGTQSMTAAEVDSAALWTAVSAVDVCLDLQGSAQTQPESGSAYRGCRRDGAGRIAEAPTAGRLHVVFRQLFALRVREGAP